MHIRFPTVWYKTGRLQRKIAPLLEKISRLGSPFCLNLRRLVKHMRAVEKGDTCTVDYNSMVDYRLHSADAYAQSDSQPYRLSCIYRF